MHWPNGIKAKGEIRTQFHHVIDIVPTILEAARVPAPRSNGHAVKAEKRVVAGVDRFASADRRAPNTARSYAVESRSATAYSIQIAMPSAAAETSGSSG